MKHHPPKATFFVLLCFVLSGYFSVPVALAASYQKIAPGDTVTLGDFVYDDDFVATTTACTVGITDPSGVEVVPSTTPMTANSNGWHYYDYTAPADATSGVWPSIMICGSTARGDLVIEDRSFVVDWSVVSTSTIKDVVDQSLTVATSSLAAVINAHTDVVSNTASSSIVSQILSSITSIPALVWSYSSRSLTTFGTLAADVWTNTTRTLTGASLDSGSLATLSDIQTATSSLASAITAGTATLTAEIQNGSTVTLSDFGQATVNTAYKAKLQVLNYATVPTDADALPTVVITDPAGTVQVASGAMTKDSNGTYSYSYSIGASALGGVWETVVSTVINGQTVRLTDYWSVSSSPADVTITSITDNIIPTITASVRIDNKGTASSDFYYVYCIVSSEDNLCGGNDDIASGSATAYINAGSYINLSLSLGGVPSAGTYWFKVKARALAEPNWAVSTAQFTADAETVPNNNTNTGNSSGSVTSSIAPVTQPVSSCSGADFNHDGKVDSIDFSILLFFWKTSPPFGNVCVDINNDTSVNSVDFSIMLYQWKK